MNRPDLSLIVPCTATHRLIGWDRSTGFVSSSNIGSAAEWISVNWMEIDLDVVARLVLRIPYDEQNGVSFRHVLITALKPPCVWSFFWYRLSNSGILPELDTIPGQCKDRLQVCFVKALT